MNARLRSWIRSGVIALLAFAVFGFHVETPETRRTRERQERAWHKELAARYDLRILRSFLVAQIEAHPSVEGVDLSPARVSRKWKTAGHALVCGDWMFWTQDPMSDRFSLSWVYESIDREDGSMLQRLMVFSCIRESRTRFRLLSAAREDEELIILSP